MNNMELFEKTFSHMHASENTLEEVYKMIDHQKRRFFPKRTVTIAIATILILSLSTIALATRSFWSPVLVEWFGLSNEQQEELMDLGATTFVGLSAEDNDLTVTVEQVLGDEFGFYVLVCIETENAEIYSEKASPIFQMYMDGDLNKNISDKWSWTDWALNGNTATMYIGCWANGNSDHVITFRLTELMGSAKTNYANIWEGNANISWNLSYNDTTTEHFGAVQCDGVLSGPTIDHVCLTPVSVCVYYSAANARDYMKSMADENCLLLPASITLDDGSSYDLSMSGSSSTFILDRDGVEQYYMVRVSTEQFLTGRIEGITISAGSDVISYRLIGNN